MRPGVGRGSFHSPTDSLDCSRNAGASSIDFLGKPPRIGSRQEPARRSVGPNHLRIEDAQLQPMLWPQFRHL